MINLRDALGRTELGPVLATHKMTWYRPDGVEDFVTIEIGVPVQAVLDEVAPETGMELWACGMRCSVLPKIYNTSGGSSLQAIVRAACLAVQLLRHHPCAEQLMENILPYFGLAVRGDTSPEAFAAEHARPKHIRMPDAWRDEPGYQEYVVLE